MNYNQNTVNEYSHNDKVNNARKFIIKIIILAISLVHYYFLANTISGFLAQLSFNTFHLSEEVTMHIARGYIYLSILFILIAVWNIFKERRFLKILYFVGLFGLIWINYKDKIIDIYNNITGSVKASFVIDTKNVYKSAKTQWEKDTITIGNKQMTYTKNGDTYCPNKRLVITLDGTDYSITLNNNGEVIKYIVTDGKFLFNYSGNGLNIDDITKDKFVKVDETNKDLVPKCN